MRTPLLALAALTLALAGCSSSTGPDDGGLAPLAASYVTTMPAASGTAFGSLVFTTTQGGVTTDHAAAGAQIRLILAADGTTSGRLYVPDSPAEQGGTVTFDQDLAGTWSVAGGVVTLRHAADTFLRDMPLTVRSDGLVGDRTFGSMRVRVTLVRQ